AWHPGGTTHDPCRRGPPVPKDGALPPDRHQTVRVPDPQDGNGVGDRRRDDARLAEPEVIDVRDHHDGSADAEGWAAVVEELRRARDEFGRRLRPLLVRVGRARAWRGLRQSPSATGRRMQALRPRLRALVVVSLAWALLVSAQLMRLDRSVATPALRLGGAAASGAVRTARAVGSATARLGSRRPIRVVAGTVVALLAAGVVAFAVAYARTTVPPEVAARPTVVVDADGRELGTLRAQAYRPVEVARLPPHVVHAVLATEDRSFYDHTGVSLAGVVRAAWANLTSGEVRQGGSTITQQYVGVLTGTPSPGYRGKMHETLIALKLERRMSKQEILQRYLNVIYWGRGAYGLGAAATTYFGVPATDLDVNQAATLAAMIAQPEELDPVEAPEALDERRTYTLRGMTEEGWLPAHEAERLVAAGVQATLPGQAVAHDVGAYYLDAVRDHLTAELGEDALLTGYRVTVEMDRDLQALAERTLADRLAGQPFTGALVAIDPRDGGVRALVGGRDYQQQELNAAVEARRQPGSAFKPFTLATFVEKGFSPDSRFDAPAEIEVEVPGEDVEVANYGGDSHGVQTVEEATWTSTNTVYMQLLREVGPAPVIDLAHRAGIASELPEVPTIALGTGVVTPFELATAYATFAGGGVQTQPRLIREVTDHAGRIVLRAEPQHHPAIATRVAQVVTDVLTGVVQRGTGETADIGRPVAGKTGTTDEHRDAWFAGYVAELATVVWYGKLDNSPMDGMTGGRLPAETWAAFMAPALQDVPVSGFPRPDLSGLKVLHDAPPPPPPTRSPTRGDQPPKPRGSAPPQREAQDAEEPARRGGSKEP
ncbi:MAG TPA: transglycosylase domain-containing protein, partial [Nitriliruptorales bacterium]|nr:transglycosylase domain-containing protein [Nitriliruptorales bacterium]